MGFCGYLRKSTQVTITIGPFVDDDDGTTEKTGATFVGDTDIFLSKNGAAKANPNDTNDATEDANGIFRKQLSTTDTNTLGLLTVYAHITDTLYLRQDYQVVTANWYDSMCSTDKLDVNVEEWNATSVPSEHTAGYPIVTVKDGTGTGEINTTSGRVDADITHIATAAVSTTTAQLGVNVVQISEDATAANNCEAFFDGNGYAGTNNVIPTLTTVTNQLTAAAIATGVWQDATAGDFTTASSIGKALYINNVAPGGSGGHMISGTNSGTTTLGALTVTGATILTGEVTGTNASNDLRGISVNMIKHQSVTCTTGVTFNANVGTTTSLLTSLELVQVRMLSLMLQQ